MSIQVITTQPNEGGTAVVAVSPTDEDGNPLVFAQLGSPQWQMSAANGTVIPGCAYTDSSLTSLEWVISGSQLDMLDGDDSGVRFITFIATYDSSAGSNLPLHAECKFKIQSLVGV